MVSSPIGPLARVSLGLLIAGALTSTSGQELPPGAEGPLRNDAFLPADPDRAAELEQGDQALERARKEAERAERERWLAVAFDHWYEALGASGPETVVFADDDRRLVRGVASAVRHRLTQLSPAERSFWSQRFADLAQSELLPWLGGPLRDRRARQLKLRDVERRYPCTSAAARAALALADLAWEEGHTLTALEDLRRCSQHVRGFGGEADFDASLEERRERWRRLLPQDSEQPWEGAGGLEAVGVLRLSEEVDRPRPGAGPLLPGLVFLEDGRFAVQTADEVHLFDREENQVPKRLALFRPDDLLSLNSLPPTLPNPAGTLPWSHHPTSDAGRLYLVQGRGLAGESPNALLCVEPPEPASTPAFDLLGRGLLPSLRWAVTGDLLIDAQGEVSAVPDLADFAWAEFQPGPVVIEGKVLAQVRLIEGEIENWLLAFDARTGKLLWKRFLAKGSDITPDGSRFGSRRIASLASQPLLAVGSRVFAGTHLGAGFLVDTAEGEILWGFKNRRRAPEEDGWDGGRPCLASDGPQSDILWGPADSDRLYRLPPGPLEGPVEIPRRDPLEIGEAEALLGGTLEEVLVQGRAGPERTVSLLGQPGTPRQDALFLGPGERFAGQGLVSAQRVWVSSDWGIYLFDRSRDLFLLDYVGFQVPASRSASRAGGSLHAHGQRVLALGQDTLWVFRTRNRLPDGK